MVHNRLLGGLGRGPCDKRARARASARCNDAQTTQLDDLVAGIRKCVAHAAATFGRIDVIVNNAGYGLVGALEELSDEQIARNFAANFFGAVEVTRAALTILRAQHSGHCDGDSAHRIRQRASAAPWTACAVE